MREERAKALNTPSASTGLTLREYKKEKMGLRD
jgi:hypothetical protein